MTSENDIEIVEERHSWSELPLDILRLISLCVPLADYPYFASVCKTWQTVIFSVYPADRSPLLMCYSKRQNSGACCYYSPYVNKTFAVDISRNLSGTMFCYAKDGWLLLNRVHEVMLVNPMTGSLVELPPLYLSREPIKIAFSCSPSSPNCIVLAIFSFYEESVSIQVWHGQDWTPEVDYTNDDPFIMAFHSNPVFHDGCFYCLGWKGNLGVFDPDDSTWEVLDEPIQLDICDDEEMLCKTELFLVEQEGDLMAAFVGELGALVLVYKLDEEAMAWEKVFNLDTKALYVGWPASILVSQAARGTENRVYIPRLRGEIEVIQAEIKWSEGQMFFVSKRSSTDKQNEVMKKDNSGRGVYFHLFETTEQFDYLGSKEYLCSTWFEPKL